MRRSNGVARWRRRGAVRVTGGWDGSDGNGMVGLDGSCGIANVTSSRAMPTPGFRTAPDVWSAFSDLAARMGDYEAILTPGRAPLTYASLTDRMAATKAVLNAWGIGRGDRVVVALPNGPEMAVSFLTITASAIFTPLNPAYTEDEFRRYFERLRPKAVIVPVGARSPAAAAARALGIMSIEMVVDETRPAGWFELSGGIRSASADDRWNTAEDVALLLHTSGTTAKQKLVPIRQRQYLAYARAINDFFRLDADDRCLPLNPMFHGSGIRGSLLVPLINGSAVVCVQNPNVETFFRYLDEYRPTWYVAAYTFQSAILHEASSQRSVVERSRLRFIRCSSGRLDPHVQEGLEKTFRAPVLQQYSSSETGAITCNPLPPRERKPGSAGLPVANEVEVMGSDRSFLRAGEEGEIVVRGPTVFDGYLGDPEANAAAFADGWYRTGDIGRFDDDGFLTICGRTKNVINRGGEKIAPPEVESVLTAHEEVRQAAIFGVPHPTLGEEIVGAVVLRESASVTEAELKELARARLTPFKVPRRILFLEAFPLTPNAKVDVRALARAFEGTRSATPTASPSLEDPIAELWRQVLGRERIGLDEDFFLAGGDSLRAAELLLLVQSRFGVELPEDAIYGVASTVTGMSRAVTSPDVGTPVDDPPSGPLVSFEDFVTAATVLALAPAAWILPARMWPSVARTLASAHVAARGSRAHRLVPAIPHLDARTTADDIEIGFVAGVYRDLLMTLREHLPGRWHEEPVLRGGEHLEPGRPAVLWSFSATFSGLMSKKALEAAGVPLVSLRSSVHPYASSRLGKRLLNPIRTRVEDRYLEDSVSVVAGRGSRAFLELGRHLDDGKVAVIAANGSHGAPLTMPFLGGTLKLALGAPSLALRHGVPLLPLFTVPAGPGRFDVVVESPIDARGGGSGRDAAARMAESYAEVLERYVRRYPWVWRGWFAQNTWEPSEEEAAVETSAQ